MKTIFLDRDGIINVDKGYVHSVSDFEFVKGIFSTCQYLQRKHYQIIIVTNQSGIARGYYTENDFLALNRWMLDVFSTKGVTIKDVFYCKHHPNTNCYCRKPKAGMFFQAEHKYKISKEDSWMLGDKETDIEAAVAFGISNTILKQNTLEAAVHSKAKYLIRSLDEIIKFIV